MAASGFQTKPSARTDMPAGGEVAVRQRKAISGAENEGRKAAVGSDRCERFLDRTGRLKAAGTPLRRR